MPRTADGKKVRANAKCPCGLGPKFKDCCGNVMIMEARAAERALENEVDEYIKAVHIMSSEALGGKTTIEFLHNLAYTFRVGNEGIPIDKKKAFTFYRRLAETGSVKATLQVALMSEIGEGIPQNYKLALEMYRRCAAEGDETGPLALGEFLWQGRGVDKDEEAALAQWRLTAAKGSAICQGRLKVAESELALRRGDKLASNKASNEAGKAYKAVIAEGIPFELHLEDIRLGRTCDLCGTSGETTKIMFCDACHLACYCSKACLLEARPAHAEACAAEMTRRTTERKGKAKAVPEGRSDGAGPSGSC